MDPNFTREREQTRSPFMADDVRQERGPILSRTDRAVMGITAALIILAVLFFSLGWAVGRNQLLEKTFLPRSVDTTTTVR